MAITIPNSPSVWARDDSLRRRELAVREQEAARARQQQLLMLFLSNKFQEQRARLSDELAGNRAAANSAMRIKEANALADAAIAREAGTVNSLQDWLAGLDYTGKTFGSMDEYEAWLQEQASAANIADSAKALLGKNLDTYAKRGYNQYVDRRASEYLGGGVQGNKIVKPEEVYPNWREDLLLGDNSFLAQVAKQDPGLARVIFAQMAAESGFDLSATSPAGAQGLMQFMEATAKDKGMKPDDVRNPYVALPKAVQYLHDLANYYNGDIGLALAAYNGGRGNVNNAIKEWKGKHPKENRQPTFWEIQDLLKSESTGGELRETKEYVPKIIHYAADDNIKWLEKGYGTSGVTKPKWWGDPDVDPETIWPSEFKMPEIDGAPTVPTSMRGKFIKDVGYRWSPVGADNATSYDPAAITNRLIKEAGKFRTAAELGLVRDDNGYRFDPTSDAYLNVLREVLDLPADASPDVIAEVARRVAPQIDTNRLVGAVSDVGQFANKVDAIDTVDLAPSGWQAALGDLVNEYTDLDAIQARNAIIARYGGLYEAEHKADLQTKREEWLGLLNQNPLENLEYNPEENDPMQVLEKANELMYNWRSNIKNTGIKYGWQTPDFGTQMSKYWGRFFDRTGSLATDTYEAFKKEHPEIELDKPTDYVPMLAGQLASPTGYRTVEDVLNEAYTRYGKKKEYNQARRARKHYDDTVRLIGASLSSAPGRDIMPR